jgi:hypothetical protein
VRKLSILIAGAVMALAVFVTGCGGGDEPEVSVPEDDSQAVQPGGGLVALNKFLEFNGQRYMLTLELTDAMVEDDEFSPIGEATSADIRLTGGNVVYERDSDPDAVYTLASAAADDGKLWLRWAKS